MSVIWFPIPTGRHGKGQLTSVHEVCYITREEGFALEKAPHLLDVQTSKNSPKERLCVTLRCISRGELYPNKVMLA